MYCELCVGCWRVGVFESVHERSVNILFYGAKIEVAVAVGSRPSSKLTLHTENREYPLASDLTYHNLKSITRYPHVTRYIIQPNSFSLRNIFHLHSFGDEINP